MDWLGFHSLGLEPPVETFAARADTVAAGVGLSLVGVDSQHGSVRKYSRDGAKPVSLLHSRQAGSHVLASLVSMESFVALGEDVVGTLFCRLATEFKPFLARSFDELSLGVIQESELSGTIEFLDWFQYFSAPLAARWGTQVLSSGVFSRVHWAPNGGACLWLFGSPLGCITGRRAAADHLGIALRPAIARNPKTGAPIVIPWT